MRRAMTRALARLTVRPFRGFVALLFLLASVSYVFGAPRPMSVQASLPAAVRMMWGACLFAGGVLLLLGLAAGWRRTEKAGLLFLAAGSLVYGICVVGYAGPRAGTVPAGLAFAVALASLVDTSDRLHAWALRVLAPGPHL